MHESTLAQCNQIDSQEVEKTKQTGSQRKGKKYNFLNKVYV